MLYASGFDVGELSEDMADDLEGLDVSSAYVANLLSAEPADGKSFILSYLRQPCNLRPYFICFY